MIRSLKHKVNELFWLKLKQINEHSVSNISFQRHRITLRVIINKLTIISIEIVFILMLSIYLFAGLWNRNCSSVHCSCQEFKARPSYVEFGWCGISLCENKTGSHTIQLHSPLLTNTEFDRLYVFTAVGFTLILLLIKTQCTTFEIP